MPLRTSQLAMAWLLAATICLRATADEASDQYTIAAGHYSAARWQLSADEFETFLTKFPKHTRVLEATFFRAEALVQLGQLVEAETCFGELLRRWPEGRFAAPALFRRGEAAYLAGHDRPARAALEQFVARNPTDPRNAYALAYLAETTLTAGEPKAARELFDQALTTYPQGPLAAECRLGLGKTDEALGKIEDARTTYRKLMDAADTAVPLADEASYRLGLLEHTAGHHEKAVEILAPLVTESDRPSGKPVDPVLVDKAAVAQGWALYKLERYADAEQCLAPLVERATRQTKRRNTAWAWCGPATRGGPRQSNPWNWSCARPAIRHEWPKSARPWRSATAGPND